MKKRKFCLLIASVVATDAILATCGSDEDTSYIPHSSDEN